MAATFLVGSPHHSWREWLRDHRGSRDILCLDPDEPDLGYPGRLSLIRDGKPIYTRFFGGLDAQRAPHILIAALAEALPHLRDNALVVGFKYRATPTLRQTLLMLAQLARPEQILIPGGLEVSRHGFPVGPEEVELPVAFPPMVHHAQRKAQWLKLNESTEMHSVSLRDLPTEGVRLGSGTVVHPNLLPRSVYLEATGSSLLAVCPEEPAPDDLAKALDLTGTTKGQLVSPEEYDGLLCAFCRDSGEEFGYGYIHGIDWSNFSANIRSTAIPPAPVRLLRVGGLRIDERGRERGELKFGSV